MIRQPRKKNKPSTSECLLNTKANNHHQSQQHLTCPPFSLYADKTKASFEEGWASVVKLLEGRKNIAVLTGAGISVSCGIPDFRSKESGLYATLDAEVRPYIFQTDRLSPIVFHINTKS